MLDNCCVMPRVPAGSTLMITQIVSLHNNYLCTCDLYSPVHNVLEACIYITWGSWRGLGPGIPEFFGPCEMGTSQSASSIWGPKN
jgi:hypothetical protein